MSKNIVENWIDQNSKRLSELSGKNKPLYDSVFDALLYLNNYIGGEAITTKIPEPTPKIDLQGNEAIDLQGNEAIDLTETKIRTYNNEYTELFLKYIFENGVPLPRTVKSVEEAIEKYSKYRYWYITNNYDVGFYSSKTAFKESDFPSVTLERLNIIPPFVRFPVGEDLQKKKIAVDSVQEAQELIEMLKRSSFETKERGAIFTGVNFVDFGNRSASAIAKDEFFYFAPIDDGVQEVLTDNSRRGFDQSNYEQISFLSFKQLFNKKLEEQYPDEIVANQKFKVGDFVQNVMLPDDEFVYVVKSVSGLNADVTDGKNMSKFLNIQNFRTYDINDLKLFRFQPKFKTGDKVALPKKQNKGKIGAGAKRMIDRAKNNSQDYLNVVGVEWNTYDDNEFAYFLNWDDDFASSFSFADEDLTLYKQVTPTSEFVVGDIVNLKDAKSIALKVTEVNFDPTLKEFVYELDVLDMAFSGTNRNLKANENEIEAFKTAPAKTSDPNKIEIGDWVRLVNANFDTSTSLKLKYGDIGEVVGFDGVGDPDIVWINTELQADNMFYSMDRFELAVKQPKPLFKIGDIVQWKENVARFQAKKGARGMVKAYSVAVGEMFVQISWLNTKSNLPLINGQKDGGYDESRFEAISQPKTQPKTLLSTDDLRIGVMTVDDDGDVIIVGVKDKSDGTTEKVFKMTKIFKEFFPLLTFGYHDDETFDFEIKLPDFYLKFRYAYDQDSYIEWKEDKDKFWWNTEGNIDEIWNYLNTNLSLYIDEYVDIIENLKLLFDKLQDLQTKKLLRSKDWQPTKSDPTPTQQPRKTKGVGATGKKPKTTKIVDKNLITLPPNQDDDFDDLLDDIENLEF